MLRKKTTKRLDQWLGYAARTAAAAGLQSLAVILSLLMAFPPGQAEAQQPKLPTHYVPLAPTAYQPLNPPNDLLGNPQYFPAVAVKPSTISSQPGTDLTISGSTVTSISVAPSTNCASSSQASTCFGAQTALQSFNSAFPNLSQQGSCTLLNTQNAIVQCIAFQQPNRSGVSFPVEWEKASVDAYLIAHGHPASDDQYVYMYGRRDLRDEVRTWMMQQVVGIIDKKSAGKDLTADEQSVYAWINGVVWANEVAAAQGAANEYKKFGSDPCHYQVDQNVAAALGVTVATEPFCAEIIPGFGETNPPPIPPASYFQTIGHTAAFEKPLGTAGLNSLVFAQHDAYHLAALATQSAPVSISKQAVYAANSVALPVALGVGGGIYAQMANIAPFRFNPEIVAQIAQARSYTAYTKAVRAKFQTFSRPGNSVASNTATETDAALETTTDAAPVAETDVVSSVDSIADIASAADLSAGVVGIVLFFLTVLITGSINIAQSGQNQSDDDALQPYATKLLNAGPPDLTAMAQTSQGLLEIQESFIQTTLPDFPSTTPLPSAVNGNVVPLPSGSPIQGWFSPGASDIVNVGAFVSNQYLQWYDPMVVLTGQYAAKSFYNTGALWNGFIVSNIGQPNESFSLSLRYADQYGTERKAALIPPNFWEVEPYVYDPNAPFCPAGSNGVTDIVQYQIFQCGSYVQESLLMKVGNYFSQTSAPAQVYVAIPPTLTDPTQIGLIVGQTQLNFTPSRPAAIVPDGAVACTPPGIVSATSSFLNAPLTPVNLPQGLTIGGQPQNGTFYTSGTTISGKATSVNDAGKTFPLTVYSQCGVSAYSGYAYDGLPAYLPTAGVPAAETVNLVVATDVVFDGLMSSYPGYVGAPFSATIKTQSKPTATLQAKSTLPAGLTFKDNGDGTATISGVPTAAGTIQVQVAGTNTLTSKTATIPIAIGSSTPVFLSPQGNVFVYSGSPGDSTDTIKVITNAIAPLTLTAPGLDSHFTFTDNHDGTGTLVFTDANNDFLNISVTLKATETNNTSVSASTTFKATAEPIPPSVSGVKNGPLAFVTGVATPPNNLPTILTSSANNTITTTGLTPLNFAFGSGIKSTLPNGLAFTNNSGGNVSIQGIPQPGSGGYYIVPIGINNGTVAATEYVHMVVYEAPSFPIYSGKYSLIFRTGTPRTVNLGAVSGFPLGKFQAQDVSLGSSVGIVYALNSTATLDPTTNQISGTPFAISGGLSGLSNGTLLLAYNGASFTPGPYTLKFAEQVVTGPVPAAISSGFGALSFIDQAALNVTVYVAPPGDANLDGTVNCTDYSAVKAVLGASINGLGYSTAYDMNGDGVINNQDLLIVAQSLAKGTVCH